MINKFKTQRERKNKRFPYVVFFKGKKHYLFLLTKSSSCSKILDIQRDFKNEEIIFGYVDKDVEKWMQIEDATNFINTKGVGGAANNEVKNYQVFYFDGKNFYNSTLIRDGKHNNGNMKIRNIVSKSISDIIRIHCA